MSKQRFLKILEEFNENFYFDFTKVEVERLTKKMKEHYHPKFCRLDIKRIKQITLNNANCFEELYKFDDELLFYLFEIMLQIEQGLIIYEDTIIDYKREIKIKARNNALQKKIDAIIQHAESVNFGMNKITLKDLSDMKTSLDNYHFTERQLFQSLLYSVTMIHSSGKNNTKASNITNKIIRDYYGIEQDNIHFTKSTNTNLFKLRTYTYGICKLKLMHD